MISHQCDNNMHHKYYPIRPQNPLTVNNSHAMTTVITSHMFINITHKAQNPFTTNDHQPASYEHLLDVQDQTTHYSVHKRPLLDRIQSQINSSHILPSHFVNTHCNTFLPSTSGYPRWYMYSD